MVAPGGDQWWLFKLLLAYGLLFVEAVSYPMRCRYFNSPKELVALTRTQSISMPPDYGLTYSPGQSCVWRIKSETPGHVIKLVVDASNLEGPNFRDLCDNDYVDIYDVQEGHDNFMERFCGWKDVGKIFRSSSSEMMIHFISNIKLEFTGFSLSYSSVPKPEKADTTGKKAMAIGIPVGVITLCIALCLAICFRRWWRSKRQARAAAERDSPRLHPQVVISQPAYTAAPTANDYPVPFVSENFPPPPDPPEFSDELQVEVRSSTPPPSYEYLVSHEGLLGPHGEPAFLKPPDYESIMKDEPVQGFVRDSSV